MEQMTAFQAWQELKKVQKFFNVLSESEKVLGVLAEYEKTRDGLQADSKNLKSAIADDTKKLSDLGMQLADMRKVVEAAEKQHKDRVDAQAKEYLAIKNKLEAQLEEMKLQARAHVEGCRMELAKLQADIAAAKNERVALQTSLDKLKGQIQDQYNQMVGAFEKLK